MVGLGPFPKEPTQDTGMGETRKGHFTAVEGKCQGLQGEGRVVPTEGQLEPF